MATVEHAPFELLISPPNLLSQTEELAMLRTACGRTPDSEDSRLHLATALVKFNSEASIAEAVELIRSRETSNPILLSLLTTALLGRGDVESNLGALESARRCVELSESPRAKASALTDVARALIRMDRTDEGRAVLHQALALDPGHKRAFKALNALEIKTDHAEDALQAGQAVAAQGVSHAHIASGQQIALAKLGRMDEARAALGLDRFLVERDPPQPEGWPTHEAFHQALAAEILNHPDLRHERRQGTVNKTWFIDQMALKRTPAIQQMRQLIQREVTAYVANLPAESTDPFVLSRPQRAIIRDWCVVVDGVGHEMWHMHRSGWLSGAYYVQVPDHVANGTNTEGCLIFGIPENLAGELAAQEFGIRVVRPRVGHLTMFPSHAYHRTFAHGGDESVVRRICYSFDIVPV